MNRYRMFILLFGFCVWIQMLNAQDPVFSQYNASPHYLNPALTGFFNGDIRLGTQFRSQWGSFTDPFRTYGAYVDGNIFKGKLKHDFFGVGMHFYGDTGGDSRFGFRQAGLSSAYRKSLGSRKKHLMGIGIHGSLFQRRLQQPDGFVDRQYNGVRPDPNLPTDESLLEASEWKADLGVGILYQFIPGRYSSYYGGASMYHILTPEVSLLTGSNLIWNRKYTLHAGGSIYASSAINLLPSFAVIYQFPAFQTMAGSYIQFVLDDDIKQGTAFAVGAWGRYAQPGIDAIIFGARLDLYQFILGVSYDMNVSGLKEVSRSRGAYEVSLIYNGYFNTKGKRNLTIPCPQL